MIKFGKYGAAAEETAKVILRHSSKEIRSEWDKTMNKTFPEQPSSRSKACPRIAFLGLCEDGLVKGIAKGSYGVKDKSINKKYAIDAAFLILNGGEANRSYLWKKVAPEGKSHNSQMDVVIALSEAGLLTFPDNN